MNNSLTVIMPVFNAWPYLPESVESILRQVSVDLKFIIIDDGSTDESVAYLGSLTDQRVVLIRNKKNQGVVASYNNALTYADTQFVARMDADDICEPDKYEKQIHFMNSHPECIMVGTSAWHMSSDGNHIGWPIQMPETHDKIINSLLSRRSAMICPTTVARTSVVKTIGGYHNWPAEDYEHYFAMGLNGKLANLPDRLYTIRLHNRSVTANNMIALQKQYELIRSQYLPLYVNYTKKHSRHHFKLLEQLDIYAVLYYRKAITSLLNEKFSIMGYIRLIFSCFLGPKRTLIYLKRRIFRA